MDKLKIKGGRPLLGTMQVSGAKNAALPILMSSLLTDAKSVFSNVPKLRDISTTLALLNDLGVKTAHDEHCRVTIDPSQLNNQTASYQLVKTMRASILVLGPLLAKYGKASVSLPGGCAIGARPVDLHLSGLKQMGAKISVEDGYVHASCNGRLVGAAIFLDKVSVGATENLMMAACLAQGETIIDNAAREPEIVDLATCLNSMGASVSGAGTSKIHIVGQDSLHGATHSVLPDRIETGTFLVAAAATRGRIRCENAAPETLKPVLSKLVEAGANIEIGDDWIELDMQGKRASCVNIETAPHPGFPTDMQAQFMSLNCVGQGAGLVTETIFENRFMHVPELTRMGAEVELKGNSVLCRGKNELQGAPVMATDLRASASLVIAGLVASGETTIDRIYHLDRGYENIEGKLSQLGADIKRVSA